MNFLEALDAAREGNKISFNKIIYNINDIYLYDNFGFMKQVALPMMLSTNWEIIEVEPKVITREKLEKVFYASLADGPVSLSMAFEKICSELGL